MIAGKFTRYNPTSEKLLEDASIIKNSIGMDVIFLQTEQGDDWYEIQSRFSLDTIKIVYDENGIITSYSPDVSQLNPVDSFVAEISKADFPEGVDILGGWGFDGEKVIQLNPDPLDEINSKKVRLINEATTVIATLQDAVDLSIATTQEVESLREWKIYRVLLNRVDPNEPDWPLKPTQ
ncbi:tail fiber assembly protein [Enterobacter vonholyi]|uniref:tail fiber assembly protein n=1 Tax=Enterobacter vonholyi TaxID=2797505 RepID=UPI0026657543|nr:tail fiber assembly protein [Enterobacter vonholyi]MDO2449788.1 tail fiber assembly protein [Enterobacter vonholyi]